MRIALVSDGGIGSGALPALIAALRRRGWSVIPVLLPGSAPGLGAALLSDLCGSAAVSGGDLPAVDVTVVAPCEASLLAALQAPSGSGPGWRAPVVVVPIAAAPAATAFQRAGWRLAPPGEPVLGGGVSDLLMASPEVVCQMVAACVAPQDLAGTRVLVTAGPTCEDLDPVRFLSNRSSGLMGLALALAAWRRGGRVTLVHGPLQVDIPRLPELQAVPVRSAREMQAAVLAHADAQQVAILCAAVADFMPAHCAERKIKKGDGAGYALELVRAPDILATLGALPRRPFLVGFAAETHDLHAHAFEKLRRKNCDLLCANDVTEPGSGFGVATNRITLFARDGSVTALPLLSKADAAERVLDRVVAALPVARLSP
jgi:phosphopantothenoylcysteine decarboxylase/phosphopantothenate--cysteine ligase